MHLIGKNRSPESYPLPNRAAAAFANRYQMTFAAASTPSPFASGQAPRPLAAANIVRRASGIFQVDVSMTFTAGGADPAVIWGLYVAPGTTTGGVVDGDWLVDVASALTSPAVGAAVTAVGSAVYGTVAGDLTQTVMIGGLTKLPAIGSGPHTIVFTGASSAQTITPAIVFASAFELP